ncbi:hypothetical protein I312_103575 [Cryptococcus bacillisporus CA1280]|uniref:uncharacterized protein n=1 Tax=Cryptococcus bacillisporus CA1280 TaxID=1296109 RepID=UPI0033698AF8
MAIIQKSPLESIRHPFIVYLRMSHSGTRLKREARRKGQNPPPHGPQINSYLPLLYLLTPIQMGDNDHNTPSYLLHVDGLVVPLYQTWTD